MGVSNFAQSCCLMVRSQALNLRPLDHKSNALPLHLQVTRLCFAAAGVCDRRWQEVMLLTRELVDSQQRSALTAADSDDDDDDEGSQTAATRVSGGLTDAGMSSRDNDDDDDAARAWLASDVTWKQGDKCRAIWSENHQYVHICLTFFSSAPASVFQLLAAIFDIFYPTGTTCCTYEDEIWQLRVDQSTGQLVLMLVSYNVVTNNELWTAITNISYN